MDLKGHQREEKKFPGPRLLDQEGQYFGYTLSISWVILLSFFKNLFIGMFIYIFCHQERSLDF